MTIFGQFCAFDKDWYGIASGVWANNFPDFQSIIGKIVMKNHITDFLTLFVVPITFKSQYMTIVQKKLSFQGYNLALSDWFMR